MKRSMAAELPKMTGEEVLIKGWVNARRNHGKIVFIDLRDRTGIVQVVTDKGVKAGNEDVIEIKGVVNKRPKHMVNPEMETGSVEVEASELKVLNKAKTLPFPIDDDGYNVNEETRLKYRYLDLRRKRLSQNLKIRFKAAQFLRKFLEDQGFLEIDTPILTKTTPEGARDFLVPSRLQRGKFYALPQSPQQYKQMLMVSGFERYFQFARCFRDEDPRADRAYGEFTQLDMEMSFVEQEDILNLVEEMFTRMIEAVFPNKKISQSPWPRIPHKNAMEKYGSDKPDLRKDRDDPNELAFAWTLDFPLFTEQSEDDFFHGSGKAKFAPSHHMFTAPHPDDVGLLDTDPLKVRGLQHDLVLNGFEVGGGSIRIHDPKIQAKVFDLIGFSDDQKKQFEHILTAFEYGVPPHGGIASGFDRLLMVLQGEPNLREVMAFPANSSGKTAVVDAPSDAEESQLLELSLSKRGSGQSVLDRIKELLEVMDVDYKERSHKPVFTSQEAAEVRGEDLASGAKALVFVADDKPLLIVVSAEDKVSLNRIKKQKKVGDLRMASKDEVKQFTGVEVGAVPPIGKVMDLPTLVDKKLAKNQVINFNAGRHDVSISMKYEDYLKVEEPEEVDISQ